MEASKILLFFIWCFTSLTDGDTYPSTLLKRRTSTPHAENEIIEINKFPWLASIHKDGEFVCAGAIVSNMIILTAAKCTEAEHLKSLKVRVGSSSVSSGGVLRDVIAATRYKNDSRSSIKTRHNLALLKLKQAIHYDFKIMQTLLARRGSLIRSGTTASTAGWGWEKKDLKITRLTNIKQCADEFWNQQICAYTAEANCNSDVGGPLVISGFLVGILSEESECSGTDIPKIYTGVSEYVEWIYERVNFMR